MTIISVPGYGTAVVNGDNTVRYTPNSGFAGADSFGYEISDGHGGFDSAAVNITVSGPTITKF